ncbi:DUF6443 domain-containing protein [Bacteroides reticulotermitis]|uniref:DUF6443 domain-containing protein n=1 Tax=Bacteroides reticulotermitis TaxID=1133319 RepID=UPI003A83F66F
MVKIKSLFFLMMILPYFISFMYCQNTQQGMSRAKRIDIVNATFVYNDIQNTERLSNDYVGEPANEAFYALTFFVKSTLRIRANFIDDLSSVYIYVLDAKGKCISKFHKAGSISVDSGTYYVVVEGTYKNGNILTEIDVLADILLQETIIDVGYISNNFSSYSHTQDTKTTGKGFVWEPQTSTNDVFYKFTLNSPMELVMTHAGSELSNTYLILMMSSGYIITHTSENRDWEDQTTFASTLRYNLNKGTYYVVSCGKTDNGKITTTIRRPRTLFELGDYNDKFVYENTQDTKRTSNSYIPPRWIWDASPNDVFYRFTLDAPMDVFVENQSELKSTRIFLIEESPEVDVQHQPIILKGGESPYIGDGSGVYSLLKGTYNIIVEGHSDSQNNIHNGLITTFIRGMPCERVEKNLGDITTPGCTTVGIDTRRTSNAYGNPFCNDIYYKFELSRQMDFLASLGQNSELDCVNMYLLNQSEALISFSNDSLLHVKDLPRGIYYFVVEGTNGDGNISIEMKRSGLFDLVDPTKNNSNNYVLTRIYTDEKGKESRLKMEYFDGLGRPFQSILVRESAMGNDLVSHKEYDGVSRMYKEWLPCVTTNSTGLPVPVEILESLSPSLYQGDSQAYSEIIYEASPLNRILEQFGPGNAWRSGAHSVKSMHLTNIVDVDTLNCIYYTATYENDTIFHLNKAKSYDTGSLYVIRVENEDGDISFEFKDKLDRLILSRQMRCDEGGSSSHDTYYIYDDFGNQTVVLPPEASDMLKTGSSTNSWKSNAIILQKYAYLYRYDHRNRCIAKKLPGCDWILYVYDHSDRLVFSQDGNQRIKKEWSFSISDVFGRECFTGICMNVMNAFSNHLDKIVVKGERSAAGSYKGYSLSGVTLVVPTILAFNYYDDYQFMDESGILENTDAEIMYEGAYEKEGFGKRYTASAKGLLTGTLIGQLDNFGLTSTYLYSVMYYDDCSRLIQTKSNNHLGGFEKEYVGYNFVGQPIKRMRTHSVSNNIHSELYTYTYDHAGRLLTTKHQYQKNNDSALSSTLVDNKYDELGRLAINQRNGQEELETLYTYNVRSWVKSLDNSLFKQTLFYTEKRPNGTNTPFYNGNISGMDWQSNDRKQRGYDFAYDNLSRLTQASYLEDHARCTKFDTSYSYDKHGNMLSLRRNGNKGTSTYGEIDNLTLFYCGNQLLKVDDSAANPSLSMSMDFKDGVNQDNEYSYDKNGNLTKDLNKGINNISYNFLNLPRRISFSGVNKPETEYVYSASGAKLSAIHRSSTEKRTDYIGNMIYENGSLKRILVDGGYIESGQYHFYLCDHLGNNRVVAKADGSVVQTNHYYPYGMTFAESTFTDKQPYKYNNKELDMENGLNLYDYEARQLDLGVPRFTTIDPLAEKYYSISPYAYCANNPLRFMDPDGRDVWEINQNGEIVNRIKDKTQDAFYKVDSEGKRLEGDGSSMVFAYGTIKSQREVTINVEDANGNINKETIAIFEVKGDENASNLFNFIISPETNNVEWGLVQVGSAKAGLNLLGTMQEKTHSGMGSYALGYGYTIRKSDHNHPSGSTTPSESDVNNAKAISDIFPKAQFNILGYPNQPIPFNKNSPYIKPAYPGAKHGKRQPGKTW